MISNRASRTDTPSDGPRKSPKLSRSFDYDDESSIETSHPDVIIAPEASGRSEPREDAPLAEPCRAATPLSILLVDDTFVNCTILLKLFGYANNHTKAILAIHHAGAGLLPDTGTGVSICLANDGSTALEYLNTHNLVFDYVITDYNMPITNGDELIQSIHKSKRCRKEFILMSAIGQDGIKRIEKSFIHDGITNVSIFRRNNNADILAKVRSIAEEANKNKETLQLN